MNKTGVSAIFRFFFFTSLLIVSFISENLHAGDNSFVIPRVLTPAKLDQPQGDVPASVTVIDRELIEASGAREIYQLFQLVPGMNAVNADGNVPTVGYHSTLARDTRRMLVLIDGRSMYQAALARVLWNDFPLEIEDIERIEIIRGPGSAAYGANAFQGVINIISKHPADIYENRFAIRKGKNGVKDWRVSGAYHGNENNLRITAAHRQEDGFDAPLGIGVPPQFYGQDPRNFKDVDTVNLRMQRMMDEGDWEVLAGGSQSYIGRPQQENFFLTADLMTPAKLPERNADRWFVHSKFSIPVNENHSFKLEAYIQEQQADHEFGGCFKLPGAAPDEFAALLFSKELRDEFVARGGLSDEEVVGLYSNPTEPIAERLTTLATSGAGPLCSDIIYAINEKTTAVEAQDTWILNEGVRLVTGIHFQDHTAYSKSYFDGRASNQGSGIFTNLEIKLPFDLISNLGGYWEDDDLNGSYFTPRYAINWRPSPTHSVRAVYAESVRSIDLYEKEGTERHILDNPAGAYANTTALLGWPKAEFFSVRHPVYDYDVERIRSRELGYFGQYGRFEWDVKIFTEALTNLISDDYQTHDENKVDINGREIQVSWRPHAAHLLRATGSHIHTHAFNEFNLLEKRELRLAPTDIASFLWRYDINQDWLFSTAWYMADSYNYEKRLPEGPYEYERIDVQLKNSFGFGNSQLEWTLLVQRDLDSDPVVFEENLYKDRTRGWLSVSFTF